MATEDAEDPADRYAFDNKTFSFFSVPAAKLATELNREQKELSSQPKLMLRTCFLYFFELLGVKKEDKATLTILFDLMSKKQSNTGKEKELEKEQQDKMSIDFDNIVFTSTSKQAATHLRTFKRFVKILVTNLVDSYPEEGDFISMLIAEIRSFAKMKMRLFRFAFTYIGM